MKHSAVQRTGQWLMLTGSLGVALVAAGASMYISVGFGMKMGVILGVVFGLADFLKVYMPLSAYAQGGLTGWRHKIWLVAISLAVTAAVFHLVEMQGAKFQSALTANRQVETAIAEQTKIRADLERITETISVAAAFDLVEGAKKSFASAEKMVKELGIECAIRKACREAEAKLTAAKTVLANAEARDALQFQLANLKAKPKQDIEVFGPAKQLAAIMGWDEVRTASVTILILSIMAIVLLEVAAAGMAIDAGKRIAAMAKSIERRPDPTKVDLSVDRSNKAVILAAVQAAYAAADELPSQRQLAKRFGVKPSTFGDWMLDWKAKGLLPCKPTKLRVVA